MATIGQQLTTPENGWTRYDDTDTKIKYYGNWTVTSNDANTYNGTCHYVINNNTLYYEFTFFGDSFRIIDIHHTNRVATVNVTIDGVIEEVYNPNISSSGTYKILVYEKTGLAKKQHTVKVSTTQLSGTFSVDAIDIKGDAHMCDSTCNHENMDTLSFHKTLSTNLPLTIEEGKNEVHFTDDGGIYINKNDGTLKQVGVDDATLNKINDLSQNGVGGDVTNNYIINEMSNPLTMNPLEYGEFGFSNQTDYTTITPNALLPINTISGGNIPLENYTIKLTANKLYKVEMQLMGTTGVINACFYDVTNNRELSLYAHTALANGIVAQGSISAMICSDTDFYLGVKNSTNSSATQLYNSYTSIRVEEYRNNPIAQYGGFETEILFEGNAMMEGRYTLSDSIDNYNLLIVQRYSNTYEKLDIQMTSDTTPSPYEVKTSSNLGAHTAGWKAFEMKNDADSDCWHNAGGSGWISLKLAEPVALYKYNVTSRNSGTLYPISSINLFGSNNGTEYTPVNSIVFKQTAWSPNETREVVVDGKVPYLYYKWEVTSSGGYVALGELALFKSINSSNIDKSILLETSNTTVFNTDFSFKLEGDSLTQNKAYESINKIIGIKGQIPSLLVGGEF